MMRIKLKVEKKLAGANWLVRKEMLAQYWHMPTTVTAEGWVEFLDAEGKRILIYGLNYDSIKEGDIIELEFTRPGITKLFNPPLKVVIEHEERYARILSIKRSV